MARSKRGQPVHGWVIIDKSTGLLSTETANRVRRLFDAQKAGHGGTLDPLATGVLAVALGEEKSVLAGEIKKFLGNFIGCLSGSPRNGDLPSSESWSQFSLNNEPWSQHRPIPAAFAKHSRSF